MNSPTIGGTDGINPSHPVQIVHVDGVRTTVCDNRFEVVAKPGCYIGEQQAVQSFREWIKRRQAKLRESGGLPE